MDERSMWTVSKVVGILADKMTPDQRRAVADELRAMEADDDIERGFLNSTAATLDRFADEVVEQQRWNP